ncbi:hypothetical protein Q6324_27790, partial [Klebsiella pneumoniae]|nr:hypothetical protein [Klebsiella pneumoniae]
FNLGGAAHEIGVRQVAHYLWNRFGSPHRVRFVAINFESVVGEILEKVDDGQMGVVLKRMIKHGVASDPEDAVRVALKSGINMRMSDEYY